MKKILLALLLSFLSFSLSAQNVSGKEDFNLTLSHMHLEGTVNGGVQASMKLDTYVTFQKDYFYEYHKIRIWSQALDMTFKVGPVSIIYGETGTMFYTAKVFPVGYENQPCNLYWNKTVVMLQAEGTKMIFKR